jgi:hypothetical protein
MRTHRVLFGVIAMIVAFIRVGHDVLHHPSFPPLAKTQQEIDADAADRAAHRLVIDIIHHGVQYSVIPDALTIDVGSTTKVGYFILTTAGRRLDDLSHASWRSSDESVATVNDKGELSGAGKGRAVISVTDTKDNVTGSILVQVL